MIETTAVVLDAQFEDNVWAIRARVVSVTAKVHAEHALIGLHLHLTYAKPIHHTLKLKDGMLFRVGLPLVKAEGMLDAIARDVEVASLSLNFEPEIIQPMNEPSVRVPLSVLRELRGQEAVTERIRQALLFVWSNDRRTGKTQKLDVVAGVPHKNTPTP